jgi:hypothetical protein
MVAILVKLLNDKLLPTVTISRTENPCFSDAPNSLPQIEIAEEN